MPTSPESSTGPGIKASAISWSGEQENQGSADTLCGSRVKQARREGLDSEGDCKRRQTVFSMNNLERR